LFLLGIAGVFSQDGDVVEMQSSIPEDLLRPRREESPRYPIDTVIGTLGQGKASAEAYAFARRVASALLAGDMNASVLSTVNKGFLESCMGMLDLINPRFFRLGSGREEPDGAVSFLIRFAGREEGITGELFLRFEERRPPPREQVPPPVEADADSEGDSAEQNVPPPPPPPVNVPVERIWTFEDLILEEIRSRDAENAESRHRYDFPPYERLF